MIVFNADHGFYIGEHGYIGKHTVLEPKQGWPMYREVSRTPLLVHVPGIAPRRSDALVQAIDVMPTVLELAGAPVPDGLHGRSLVPVLHGDTDTHRDAVISSPLLPKEDDVLLYSTINDGEWTLNDPGNRGIEAAELYNLAADPGEEQNVIADHADVAQRPPRTLFGGNQCAWNRRFTSRFAALAERHVGERQEKMDSRLFGNRKC